MNICAFHMKLPLNECRKTSLLSALVQVMAWDKPLPEPMLKISIFPNNGNDFGLYICPRSHQFWSSAIWIQWPYCPSGNKIVQDVFKKPCDHQITSLKGNGWYSWWQITVFCLSLACWPCDQGIPGTAAPPYNRRQWGRGKIARWGLVQYPIRYHWN